MTGVWFHERIATDDFPAGFTVSKREQLPNEFRVTECWWGDVILAFIDDDNFTADERQAAYGVFVLGQKEQQL